MTASYMKGDSDQKSSIEHNGLVWFCMEYRKFNKVVSYITRECSPTQKWFTSYKMLSGYTGVSLQHLLKHPEST